MRSEKLNTEYMRALKWYATLGIDADVADTAQPNTSLSKSIKPYFEENTDICKIHDQTGDKNMTLLSLREAVLNFEGCALKATATNTVFADGISTSKIMLIGEAPGATEDAQGIPFCGESGKLLDNMIASIGLSRTTNVYITNTIFWRPPGNRAPTDQEIEICRPFVEQHIALIKPELLILVGSTAVTSLLGKHLQISKIRQEYYQYTNKYLSKPITTTALFHPAYLLRQPGQKKNTWYDLLRIKEFIDKNFIMT